PHDYSKHHSSTSREHDKNTNPNAAHHKTTHVSVSCGTATAPDHRHRTGSDPALLCCLALHVLLDARGVLLLGVEVPVMVLVIFLGKIDPPHFLTAPGHWAGPQSVAQRATHLVPAQQEVLPGFEGAQRSVHLVSTVHLPKQTGVQEEVDVGLPLLFAVLRE